MTHDDGSYATKGRDTSVSSAEGRLKVSAEDKIFLLKPNNHPLITLLTNIGKTEYNSVGMMKRETGNPEFKCFEDVYGGRYAQVSGTYAASGALTISVKGAGSESAYIFTVGDIIRNARTGENMLVATVASATTITVASTGRAFGTTAAAAGADGDGLYIVGNANEEFAGIRNVNTTRITSQTNYTQIFRKTIAVSGTEMNADLYGGSDMEYLRKKTATEHAEDIERAFLFGEKKSTTGSNGKPLRATGGILEFINSSSAYIQDQGGPLTAPDFNTFLREGFTYKSSNEKLLVASGVVVQAINEFARGQLSTVVGSTSYGVAISKYQTPAGTINIVQHPFLINDYSGYAFLLDMDCFTYVYMKGRDTKLNTNVQTNGDDGQADEWLTECGLGRRNAAYCALLKGVTD